MQKYEEKSKSVTRDQFCASKVHRLKISDSQEKEERLAERKDLLIQNM